MSKLLRGKVALILVALVIPLHAGLADAGPSACEKRTNNTAAKLLECVTLAGVREHQAALQRRGGGRGLSPAVLSDLRRNIGPEV